MRQNLRQQMHKKGEETKNCTKVQNEKAIVQNKHIVFKSQKKLRKEKENCQNFVNFNKRKTFEKLNGKMLQYMEQLGNKGLIYLNVLVLLLSNIYDLVKV